jgi:hypothetical protein
MGGRAEDEGGVVYERTWNKGKENIETVTHIQKHRIQEKQK